MSDVKSDSSPVFLFPGQTTLNDGELKYCTVHILSSICSSKGIIIPFAMVTESSTSIMLSGEFSSWTSLCIRRPGCADAYRSTCLSCEIHLELSWEAALFLGRRWNPCCDAPRSPPAHRFLNCGCWTALLNCECAFQVAREVGFLV